MTPTPTPVETRNELCQCGCGGVTNVIRFKSQERGGMKVGQHFRFKMGHKAKSPIPLKLRRHGYYLKNIEREREKRKRQYADNPEKAKKDARQWYRDNPERTKQTRAAYKSSHRKELSAQETARYWSEPVKNRAKQRKYAPKNKVRFQKRRESLSDVYVRGELAKHSPLSPGQFPQELVEAKRLHLQLKRLTKTQETK
jgi:hypothetical protein